jgi:hypothetical protein
MLRALSISYSASWWPTSIFHLNPKTPACILAQRRKREKAEAITGFPVWWRFKKLAEQKRIVHSFVENRHVIQATLFSDLKKTYLLTMEEDAADLLAAQVANYLIGLDIDEVIANSTEPRKSEIERIREQLPVHAAKAMVNDRSTREVVVATLRMWESSEFMLHGESWLQSDLHRRLNGLLASYSPDFPEEINPAKYREMVHRYREECGKRAR